MEKLTDKNSEICIPVRNSGRAPTVSTWQVVLYTLLVSWMAWLSIATINQSNDIASIKATRFTHLDGRTLQDNITEMIDRKLQQFPPEWLIKNIDEIKSELQALRKEVREIQIKVD